MSNLSDSERAAYEQYLLATTEEGKLAAINKLIPGSLLHSHLLLMDVLKHPSDQLHFTADQQKALDILTKQYSTTSEY